MKASLKTAMFQSIKSHIFRYFTEVGNKKYTLQKWVIEVKVCGNLRPELAFVYVWNISGISCPENVSSS